MKRLSDNPAPRLWQRWCRHLGLACDLTLLVLVSSAASAGSAGSAGSLTWQAKADSWVVDQIAAEGSAEFLVVLNQQADLSAAEHQHGRHAKGAFVVDRLRQAAKRSQRPIIDSLHRLGVPFRPYWIVNMVWVRGDARLADKLASRPDVARLQANPWAPLERTTTEPEAAKRLRTTEWGVDRVGAPGYWQQGYFGQGIVIGGQDTGYDWQHAALKTAYRGWHGAEVDHDYNWHDAIHSGGGICGADSPEPCDDFGHGTHTMGTMVGDDGAGNQIGVAPGARWIGCRNMDRGNGTVETYSECFQWFLAPTDGDGQNPDTARAPDVINNSWACTPAEGCTDPTVLRLVVENTRAAGIAVVVSAGNSGSACTSINTPPAIYDAAVSIGATSISNSIASFSSRGPVTVDGSQRLKPDLSAPGVSIRSSTPGGGYGSNSGTSMAAPHVAGMIAVLLSASPLLDGDVDGIEACLLTSAEPSTTSQVCGGIDGDHVPNPIFGHGRAELIWPLPSACLGAAAVFDDGFESGDTSAWSS